MNTKEYDGEFISPDALFEGSGLDKYRRLREDIYGQLRTVQHYLFSCERIESFPFRLFLPLPQDWFFWRVTRNALVEAAFITLHRVAFDDGAPLVKLHDTVMQAAKQSNPSAAKELSTRLRDIKRLSDKEKSELREFRRDFVAHCLKLSPKSPDLPGQSLDLQKLWIPLDRSWALFDILCLDKKRPHWYEGYVGDEAFRPTTRIDIDAILDRIEHDNITRLKEPEWNPMWDRSNFSAEDLAIFNEKRRKHGFSEV